MSGIDHLLDTNVDIGLPKGAEPAVALAQLAGLALHRAAVSQITRMELLGFADLTEAEEQATRGFLAACQVVSITRRHRGQGDSTAPQRGLETARRHRRRHRLVDRRGAADA